jgi:hypothetical protein
MASSVFIVVYSICFVAVGIRVVVLQVDQPVVSPRETRQVKVESWPQAKQQRAP